MQGLSIAAAGFVGYRQTLMLSPNKLRQNTDGKLLLKPYLKTTIFWTQFNSTVIQQQQQQEQYKLTVVVIDFGNISIVAALALVHETNF